MISDKYPSWDEVTGGTDEAKDEEKRAVIRVTAEKYRKGSKKEAVLEHLVELTGYTRRYASWRLRHHGRRTATGKTVVVGDITTEIECRP